MPESTSVGGRGTEPALTISTSGTPSSILLDELPEEVLLDFKEYSKALTRIILDSKPMFTVGIFGGWGTGKTTLMRTIKGDIDSGSDSDSKNAVTVWFNAWRFEREKTLVVVPLLRTIRLTLEKSELKARLKPSHLKKLKNAVQKTLTSLVEATTISQGPLTLDLGKMIQSANESGLFRPGTDLLYYDALDYLQAALTELRKENDQLRLVVFVDDLDRCSPARAFEVLESIKALLDIEGIVYVLGMNDQIIEALVKSKYEKTVGIEASIYMKKLVQVPFYIPAWNDSDLEVFLDNVLKRVPDAEVLTRNTTLIESAVQWNPREVKRFINNMVIARSIFGRLDEGLIAVQALRFNPGWSWFLQSALVGGNDFLQECYEVLKRGGPVGDPKYPGVAEKILQDRSLHSFLVNGGMDALLSVRNIDEYRRTVEASSVIRKIEHERLSRADRVTSIIKYAERIKMFKAARAAQRTPNPVQKTGNEEESETPPKTLSS